VNPVDGGRALGIVLGEPPAGQATVYVKLFRGKVVHPGSLVVFREGDLLTVGFTVKLERHAQISSKTVDSYELTGIEIDADTLGGQDVISVSLSATFDIGNGRAVPVAVPPKPGTLAYAVTSDIVTRIFGDGRCARVGILLGTDVHFCLPLRALSRHGLVVGGTGAGKSHFLLVLIEELAKLGSRFIVIDVMGEYREAISNLGGAYVTAYRDLVPDLKLLQADEFLELTKGVPTSDLQRVIVTHALNEFLKDANAQTPKDFLAKLASSAKKFKARPETQMNLTQRFEIFLKTVFGNLNARPTDAETFASIFEKAGWKLGIYVPQDGVARDLAVAYVLNLLRGLGAQTRDGRGVLIAIDEAHVLAPRHGSTLSKRLIADAVRRGRHYGLSLLLITQLPASIDEEIVSLVNFAAVFALPGTQLRALAFYLPHIDEVLDWIPKLQIGHALIVGSRSAVPIPVAVRVRDVEKVPRAPPTAML